MVIVDHVVARAGNEVDRKPDRVGLGAAERGDVRLVERRQRVVEGPESVTSLKKTWTPLARSSNRK